MQLLEDIVHHIQIHDNFAISYLDTEYIDLSEELLEVIQELPELQQQKYLASQIRNFIYNSYFKGDSPANFNPDISWQSSAPSDILENNRLSGRDWEFYRAIHAHNSGQGYWDTDWEVLKLDFEGDIAVKKQGLKIYIQPQKHLAVAEPLPSIGDRISILMPRNLLEQGYYIAVSNSGLPDEPTACIYFNVDSAGAIALMQSISHLLNSLNIPFAFKVLAHSESYWRYDAGMLIVSKISYPQIAPSLQAIYQENHHHFTTPSPLFTKVLLPGMSIAENPLNRADRPINFGMHRCQIVAQGLLEASMTGDNSPTSRMQAIHQCFDQAQISGEAPYLNPNSEDIYQLPALD